MSTARRFYDAFAARDWRTMGALYAQDAVFSDPAFPQLDAAGVRAMWQMLVTRGSDLAVTYEVLEDSAGAARVRWRARYTFSQTGRKVVNEVVATLQLRDGLILRHVDGFDFHRWAAQALGPAGTLLGWTGWLQRKVQAKAAASLRQFMQRQGTVP